MPKFLSPRFSTLRRTLMASTRMNETTSRFNLSSNSSVNNSNNIMLHYRNLNPLEKLPHYCSWPRFDVGVGLSPSMRSNSNCTASENKGDAKPGPEPWNIQKGWNVPWSLPTTLLTVAIANISFIMTFDLLSKACQYFNVITGPNAYGIIHLEICSISASALFGVILFVTRSYQSVPKDLFYWDLKEPFNVRKGWLLWTVIALACIYALCQSIYAEMPNVEEICKQWWYVLLKCTNFSTLCVFVCMGIISPVAEEVLHRGFFLASLTKWVPTPVAVGISAIVFAIVHRDPNPSSLIGHYIMGIILGLTYVQTCNLLTPIATHCLYNIALASYYCYYMPK